MATQFIKAQSIRNAVAKAQSTGLTVYRVSGATGIYTAPSASDPGAAYLLRASAGKITCQCQGFERVGVCYHAARLALDLGLMPARFQEREQAAA